MNPSERFYIDGRWVEPRGGRVVGVENPATEAPFATVALGCAADADAAVAAARRAFDGFTAWPVADRIALVERVIAAYDRRAEDLAQAVSQEMGAPLAFARSSQVPAGRVHLQQTVLSARTFPWESQRGETLVIREGIGVCALITPWNWPLNQIACKVAPALVAGCTMVLKPSEIAPVSAVIFAEICHDAGVPAGVFNLVNGTGPEVGAHLAGHPDVDMVSFTGSTRAGIDVALRAAPTVKRTTQELGGKSANLLLPGVDLATAVRQGVEACFGNSGQSCDAPTRMLVPRESLAAVHELARAAATSMVTGDPRDPSTELGPVVSEAQYARIQRLIHEGIAEGATLIAGGLGRPVHLDRGWYVQPTVFGDVTPQMAVAQQEIFGPVLVILPYDTVDQAVQIANDSVYGLAAYVQGPAPQARAIARRLRVGQVNLNAPAWDTSAPFGGYKQSGNGREVGEWGIHDFCEVKAVLGHGGDVSTNDG